MKNKLNELLSSANISLDADDSETIYFESTREHLVRIYSIRLITLREMNKDMFGLEESVKNLKVLESDKVGVYGFIKNKDAIVIFVDEEKQKIIGIIDTSKVTPIQI